MTRSPFRGVDEITIDEVADLVAALDRPVVPMVVGNLGDSLINHVAHDLEGRAPRHRGGRGSERAGPLLIPGGGNLIPLYGDAFTALERASPDTRGVILPHTIRGAAALLRSRPRVTVIAREPGTIRHLLEGGVRPGQLLLAHDLAFALGADVLTRSVSEVRGSLMALRRDAESSRSLPVDPTRTFDVSGERIGPWRDVVVTRAWARAFVDFIAHYEYVVTDRLHVAIAAALLGRPTWLLGNSYGKNRAVFDHSIIGRFPHVQWCDSWTDVPADVRARAVTTPEHVERWNACAAAARAVDEMARRNHRQLLTRMMDPLPPPFGRSAPPSPWLVSPVRWWRARRVARSTPLVGSARDIAIVDHELRRLRRAGIVEDLALVRAAEMPNSVQVLASVHSVSELSRVPVTTPDRSTSGDSTTSSFAYVAPATMEDPTPVLRSLLHDASRFRAVAVVGARRHRVASRAVIEFVESHPRLRLRVGDNLVVLELAPDC